MTDPAAQPVIQLPVPTPTGTLNLDFEFGTSTVIIGANGSGKTRLGVYIEDVLASKDIVHRIAAQKTLAMEDVQLVALEIAEKMLLYGMQTAVPVQKVTYRWGNRPATQLLNDFQALLQTLFGQQNRVAVRFLDQHRVDPSLPTPRTVLQKVQEVWEQLLPHRELELLEAAIRVKPLRRSVATGEPSSSGAADYYRAGDMSDGERAIFYLLGQCLIARKGSILVIDEPEAHVHKAISNKLWDAIEAERPDCAFVYFTHDLDFASRRAARRKYFIRSFESANGKNTWDIENVPSDSGLPEIAVSEILGSRQPILLVEGTGSSLDITTYRGVYKNFTVIPVGSCDNVIHCVESFGRNTTLHAIGAQGLIDADGRSLEEIALLAKQQIHVLPVIEIENIFLTPSVFSELAASLHHDGSKVSQMLNDLTSKAMARANENIEEVSVRYAMRRLDSRLKRVGFSAKDLPTLEANYAKEITSIDPTMSYTEMKQKLEGIFATRDLTSLLSVYDNKGLLGEAASILGLRGRNELQNLVSRLLSSTSGKAFCHALADVMPRITA
jgi:ABC-type lipoprotein export system ATPase subunit